MYKVVIFDLDDTLISEDEYIHSGYEAVAEFLSEKYTLEKDHIAEELYFLYEESPQNVFNRLLDQYHIEYEKKDILELVGKYRTHTPNIHFFPDVLPILQRLKKKGVKTGIISDGYLETQTRKGEVLRLTEWFDKVIFTEELGREFWKPHIRSFQIMKEYFGVEYDEMIYVGDNPKKDFHIKKQVPITTFRIEREKSVYKDAAYLEDVKEDYRVTDLTQLLKFL